MRRAAGRHGQSAVFQTLVQVRGAVLQCRDQATQDAGERNDAEREGHDHRVEANGLCSRENTLAQQIQGVDGQVGERKTGKPSHRRERHALGEQLAEKPRPGRANRRAHGDLARSHGAAREQQVREVGAGDQQHEGHGAEQDQHRTPDLPDQHFAQRRQADRHPSVQRLLADDVLRHSIEVGGRGCRRRARLEPAEHVEEIVAVRVHVVAGLERHRHEHLQVAAEERERRREHADDGVRLGVQRDAGAHDVGIRAETALPQAVREHHHAMRAPLFVRGDETAAHHRRCAKRAEETRRSDHPREALGLLTAGEVEGARIVRIEEVECAVPLSKGVKVGWCGGDRPPF